MEIVVLGLNHKATPIKLRERLAFDATQLGLAFDALRGRVEESAILSTCNRTEIYAVVQHGEGGARDITAFLGDFHGLAVESFSSHLYCRQGRAAVGHLFTVASGLDSMVLGEPQILGQVKDAYETAVTYHAAGPIISWVFHHALKVGKQVRSETAISRNSVSVSSAAVGLARKFLGDAAAGTFLVVGTGKMAELTIRNLVANGLNGITVVSRTTARATDMAGRYGCRSGEFERLQELMGEADVIITATRASSFVLTEAMVRQSMFRRRGRSLLIIDIAVPRDVDPSVRRLEDVVLYDIDDLQSVCSANIEERKKEVDRAENLIEAELNAFQAWWASLQVIPTISALRQRAEDIRQAELRKALARLGGLSERQRSVVEALSFAIVNKMLHQPVTRLKSQSNTCDSKDNISALRNLFALDQED